MASYWKWCHNPGTEAVGINRRRGSPLRSVCVIKQTSLQHSGVRVSVCPPTTSETRKRVVVA